MKLSIKKKIIIIISFVSLLCLPITVVFAGTPIKLIVNDQEIKADVLPQNIDGRVMVPVRWVAEALDADVYWDKQNNSVIIDKQKNIYDLPEANSKLYPFQEIDSMYDGFILEIDGKRKYFDWESVTNPTYEPKLFYNDINYDGEKELIIILTTGTGTGVHTEDIHIIKYSDFSEINVMSPSETINLNVNTKIESNGNNKDIKITLGNKEIITINKYTEFPNRWFDNVVFRDFYHYEVTDNNLILKIAAQVSPSEFIGEIRATYDLYNDNCKIKAIEFIKY